MPSAACWAMPGQTLDGGAWDRKCKSSQSGKVDLHLSWRQGFHNPPRTTRLACCQESARTNAITSDTTCAI